MTKKSFEECIKYEVYESYKNSKGRLSLFDKIWCKYLSPSTNAVYLIRKKQYLESGGRISRLFAKLYRVKLMRRYCIHINSEATIGLGLHIVHPMCISIAKCNIGINFTIYQSCTVGAKSLECEDTPIINNNVTMYAGSSIIGNCNVSDNVTIGANSLLLRDAKEAGVYIGSPAVKKN